MKKFVSLALVFCMCLTLLAGCGEDSSTNDSQNSLVSESSQADDTSDGETALTGGEVYDSLVSIFPQVEVFEVTSKTGKYNLSVYVQPEDEEIEDAFLSYAQMIRNAALSIPCQEAWADKGFSKIIFRYDPSADVAKIPKQEIFYLELEPCDSVYRIIPDSIGEKYSNYVSYIESYKKLDKTVFLSERKSKAMLEAFATAKLTDLYDELFIEENMK